MRDIIVLSFAAAVLSGCYTMPPRTDPVDALGLKANSAYKNLVLAVVRSDNTKNSMKYLHDTDKVYTRGNFGLPAYHLDADGLFVQITSMLQSEFKSVSYIDSIDNVSGDADLVAVLDVYQKMSLVTGSVTTFDYKLIFTTTDKRMIDTAAGEGSSKITFPHTWATTGKKAASEALANLGRSLDASEKLQAFARSGRNPSGGPSEAVSAAPREKEYHSDVDRAVYRLAENPNDFALVIGVEGYERLPKADFARRDAEAVRSHLIALGYPERNIIFLTGQEASKTGIQKYIEEWLPRNVDEDSRVFFYFSGHGAPDVGTRQAYLMPWDGDAKFLETTGYPIKRLYAKLNALKSKQIIVALDSCFSGVGGRSVLAPGLRPLVTKVDVDPAGAGNLIVLSASAADEATGTAEDQGHGLFTYYFLKALSATKGDATIQALYDYLSPRVQADAKRDNRDQTPQLISSDLAGKAGLRLR